MFAPWILTLDWKLNVSFASFKPELTKIHQKSMDFLLKSMDFVVFIKIHPKFMQISWILESWGLGLWSSKVFQIILTKIDSFKTTL